MFLSQRTREEWIIHLSPGGHLCPGRGPSALSEDSEGRGRICHPPWGEVSAPCNVPCTGSMSSRPLPHCLISCSSTRVLLCFKYYPEACGGGEGFGSSLWLSFRPAFPKQHWSVIPFGFTHLFIWGFPDGSDGKESTYNAYPGLIPGLGRSDGEGNGYPLQYSGLENCMDCIVHGVAKSWTRLSDFHFGGSDSKESPCTQETWVRSLGQEDPLEKGIAAHSSILTWEIPWTEELGGLRSMGSQRVRQD